MTPATRPMLCVSQRRSCGVPAAREIAISAALAAIGGIASTAAHAADSPVLEEVVVTAQFREENAQETPLAITALSAEMLEARSQTNVLNIAAQAPNVTLQPGGGTFGPALQAFIRGVGQDDFNLAYEPGVGLYIDDVYYSILSGSAVDLVDVERIEVLRGPQGTLAGRNSIGGAIKIYSKKPLGDNSGYVAATYGDYDRTEFRGAYDVAVVPDRLFLRVSGIGKSEDGYMDRVDYGCANPGSGFANNARGASNCVVGTQGGRSFTATRGALRWLAGDNLEINIIGDYTNDSSESQANHLAALVDANVPPVALASNPGVFMNQSFVTRGRYISYSTNANPDNAFGPYANEGVSQTDSWGISSTIDWRIGDHLAVKSITAYRESDTLFTNDTSSSPIPSSISRDQVLTEQFSQELRLNGAAFGGAVDYTLGGYLIRGDNRNRGSIDIHYLSVLLGVSYGHIVDDPVQTDSDAIFGHAVWHLSDRLNLTAGVRYTEESKAFTYSRKSLAGDGTVAIPTGLGVDGVTSKSSASNTDYRLNLDYELTDDVLAYVQYATGFKGGGPSPRPFNANQVSNTFGPETVETYEIGLKSDLFGSRMRVNAAVFSSEYTDKQIVLFACPDSPCASPANAGAADIWGVELETLIVPAASLQLDGSLSYIQFEYTSLNPQVIPTGITLDSTAAFTPEWQASVGAQYGLQLPGGGTLTPRIDGSYKADFYTDASNAAGSLIESYWLWNGRLTWKSSSEDWQAALEVTNLADKFYYQSLLDISAFNGIVQGNPAPPRRWAVTLTKHF